MTETSETTPPTASGPSAGRARLRAAAGVCEWIATTRKVGKAELSVAALALLEAEARDEADEAKKVEEAAAREWVGRDSESEADENARQAAWEAASARYRRAVVAERAAVARRRAALGADGGGA